MKRLFLTSGLVLCMACPVFADTPIAIPAGTDTANCDVSTLETYTGPVSFGSVWRPAISGAITLNSNRFTSNNGSAVNTASVTATPTPLYSVYGVGLYNSQATANTLSNYTTSNRLTSLTRLPELSGYNFQGFWTTPATGGVQVVEANGQFIYNNDVASTQINTDGLTTTWYARWAEGEYTLTYICSGNEGDASTSPATYVTAAQNNHADTYTTGQSYSLRSVASVCKLEGYHADTLDNSYINGWSCTGGLSAASGTWNFAQNVTCTAHWEANDIYLVWDANGGTAQNGGTYSANTPSCTYDDDFSLPPEPKKLGFHLVGWNIIQ